MAQSLKFSNSGFSARVSYSAEYVEWRVTFHRADGSRIREPDYHTDDKADAINTAQVLIGQLAVKSRA